MLPMSFPASPCSALGSRTSFPAAAPTMPGRVARRGVLYAATRRAGRAGSTARICRAACATFSPIRTTIGFRSYWTASGVGLRTAIRLSASRTARAICRTTVARPAWPIRATQRTVGVAEAAFLLTTDRIARDASRRRGIEFPAALLAIEATFDVRSGAADIHQGAAGRTARIIRHAEFPDGTPFGTTACRQTWRRRIRAGSGRSRRTAVAASRTAAGFRADWTANVRLGATFAAPALHPMAALRRHSSTNRALRVAAAGIVGPDAGQLSPVAEAVAALLIRRAALSATLTIRRAGALALAIDAWRPRRTTCRCRAGTTDAGIGAALAGDATLATGTADCAALLIRGAGRLTLAVDAALVAWTAGRATLPVGRARCLALPIDATIARIAIDIATAFLAGSGSRSADNWLIDGTRDDASSVRASDAAAGRRLAVGT
jgi:hypothetical protein